MLVREERLGVARIVEALESEPALSLFFATRSPVAESALLELAAIEREVARSASVWGTCYGAIAVAGAQLCYFNAVAHLSVGVALLLEPRGR